MASGEVKIPQAEIDALVAAIERVEKRRKLMLAGYLLAGVVLIVGQIAAFIVFAHVQSPFMAWVYLVPFALTAGILMLFGRLSRAKRSIPKDKEPAP